PPKTQAALLEAMQERQVTIEGETLPLPSPFMVLATQNPIEQEGVYRLPEAQLDRFLFRVFVGYPDREAEIGMLGVHSRPSVSLETVCNSDEIVAIQNSVDNVFCSDELRAYIIDIARKSRQHSDLVLGASPRAAISLMKAARAHALLNGRSYLTHDDVQSMMLPVLAHRLIMRAESEMDGQTVGSVIKQIIQSVPVLSSTPSPSGKTPPPVATPVTSGIASGSRNASESATGKPS
ncbi:MAG: MoxR family ATPase, partial [Planctomycetota bacterium]